MVDSFDCSEITESPHNFFFLFSFSTSALEMAEVLSDSAADYSCNSLKASFKALY